MKRTFTRMLSPVFCAVSLTPVWGHSCRNGAASAQERQFPQPSAHRCTNGKASGTYGYRMSGQIIGVGPVLILRLGHMGL